MITFTRFFQVTCGIVALLAYSVESEAVTWTAPVQLAKTATGSAEPFSYYSLGAAPGLSGVLNTGVTNVNGFVFGPTLGWNTTTNGWVLDNNLLPTSQLYSKTKVTPQIYSLPGFGVSVMQGSAGGIYAFSLSNGSWSTGTLITSDPLAQFPNVVINGNAENPATVPPALAVWNQSTANQPIYYSILSATGHWSAPATIPGSMGNYANIACDVLGNVVVVWNNHSTNTLDAVSYNIDNTPNFGIWSSITHVGTTNGGYPRVKIDAARGNAIAVWTDAAGNVVSSALPLGGTWSTPVTLSVSGGNSNPSLAEDPLGNAVAVWQSGANVIYASTLSAGSSWSPALTISPVGATGFTPEVDVDTLGNAIAVWSDGNQNIQYALLPIGGVWSAAAQLSPSGAGSILPKVGSIGDSAAAVIWEETSTGFLVASSALNIFPPVAPRDLVVCHDSKKCVNKISFKLSVDTSMIYYELYRDGLLIATIPFQGPYTYTDHYKRGATYTLVAINSSGVQSTPLVAQAK